MARRRPAARALALAVAAMAVAGCGDDDSGVPTTSAGDTTTTSTTEPPPTTEPAPPTTFAPDEPFEASFRLTGDPDYLAVADGSVWVKSFGGTVYRIDPATNQVAATIELESANCDGIGATDDVVWTCDEGGVVPIDPATNERGDTVEVQKIADQGVLPVLDGKVWILTGDGSAIVPVSEDGAGEEAELGVRCTQPSVGDTATIWIACPPDDSVIEFDPESGDVVTTIDGLDDPRAVAATDTDVWVATGDGLAHIDATTGEVVGTAADAEANPLGGVAAQDDQVWLRGSTHLLERIDPDTLTVAYTIDAPVARGGSVIIAFDSVWVTAFDDAVLYRVALSATAST